MAVASTFSIRWVFIHYRLLMLNVIIFHIIFHISHTSIKLHISLSDGASIDIPSLILSAVPGPSILVKIVSALSIH